MKRTTTNYMQFLSESLQINPLGSHPVIYGSKGWEVMSRAKSRTSRPALQDISTLLCRSIKVER